jgi:hypothetical protein
VGELVELWKIRLSQIGPIFSGRRADLAY